MHKGKLTNINPPRITTEPKTVSLLRSKQNSTYRGMTFIYFVTNSAWNPNTWAILCGILAVFLIVVLLTIYFRFLSVRLNRLKNKLLANYLRNRGNDLATVRNSAFCVAILSNNSFICKYNIFFRKYELSVAIL